MQDDKGWRAPLALGLLTAVAGAAGAAEAATAPGPASEVITLNCGGATISLTQGDQAISLTCGAATLSVPARGKTTPASTPVAPTRSSTNVASAPQAAVPAVARVPSAADAPIITLASAADDPPPAGDGTPKPAGDTPKKTDTTKTQPGDSGTKLTAHDFYVGAGFSMAQNIGSKRADDVKFITRSDGQILAQVQTSQDRSISAMFETHYLLKNQGIFDVQKLTIDDKGKATRAADSRPWFANIDNLGRILACGPFAIVSQADENRAGCGPLFTAIIDDDGKVSQFGVGWALGLGKADPTSTDPNPRSNFGIGVGLLFSPDSKVLDGRIVDTNSLLVRPQFQSLFSNTATTGTISALVNRPTTSAFLMVSKTF